MNELINLGNGQFVKVTMLKGEKGSNIATITKTGTSGLVDTYTVTLTDGSTTTFNVTNGSSIESIEKTGTVGLVDIYTITLTNGETSTFEVTNGNAENLQDAFQASQCAIKAGVSQVTFTNLGDAYITYIPNSECVENAVVVVGFDNGAMYKGTMNYSSALGKWGLSNVELIQGSNVPSTWDVGYGNDSVGTRAFRTGTDFVYSNGIGIALSTSSDVVSYYCVLSGGKVSKNYLQTQINQINSDLGSKSDASAVTGNDAFSKIGTLNTKVNNKNFLRPQNLPNSFLRFKRSEPLNGVYELSANIDEGADMRLIYAGGPYIINSLGLTVDNGISTLHVYFVANGVLYDRTVNLSE